MKVELITAQEFEYLSKTQSPSRIRRRDGWCCATIGDTAYIYPEFDFRSLLVDTMTTAAALRIRNYRTFDEQKQVTRDIYEFYKAIGCPKEVAVAGTELFQYLVGKKFGVVAFENKFKQEQIQTLWDFALDEV